MTITAAADGSALGNPGPAGWAWYVDENRWHAGGWPHGTNNQGELMAVLDLFRSTAHVPDEPLRILCDSQYVINCVTKWMPNWKRRGWKKADGKPVLNTDLLRQIDDELAGRTYTFEWVKGHAGHSLNEAADERARACASAYQAGGMPVEGPGFGPRSAASASSRAAAATARIAAATGRVASAPTRASAPGRTASASSRAAAAPGRTGSVANRPVSDIPAQVRDAGQPEIEAVQEDLFGELPLGGYSPRISGPAGTNGTNGGNIPLDVAALPGQIEVDAVVELEQELLDPETRADFGQVAYLLHPEFREIGQSGRLWDRDEILDALVQDPELHISFELVEATPLGHDLIQVLYRTESAEGSFLRSSLWQRADGRWRLRFHQGTPEA